MAMSPPPRPTRADRRAARLKAQNQRSKEDVASAAVPELALAQFASAPFVEFDAVEVGSFAVRKLKVVNPSEDAATVTVARIPERKGFQLFQDEACEVAMEAGDSCPFGAGESRTMFIKWAPKKEGGCRESLVIKLDGKYPVSAVLLGNASVAPEDKEKKSRRARGRESSRRAKSADRENSSVVLSKRSKRSKSAKTGAFGTKTSKVATLGNRTTFGKAQKKPLGTLVGNVPAQSQAGRTRKQSIVKDDEAIIATLATELEQLAGTPADGAAKTQTAEKSAVATSSASAHGTDRARARKHSKARRAQIGAYATSTSMSEAAARRTRSVTYDEKWADKQQQSFTLWLDHLFQPEDDANSSDDATGHKRLHQARLAAQVRRRAFRVYNTPEMDELMYNIDEEVAAGRLAIRSDREIHADLGLRDELTSIIMCYTPAWLRVGLETVFGEKVEGVDEEEDPKGSLRKFIQSKLLTDSDITAAFAHTRLGKHSKAYAAEQHRQTLRRFLRLVLFLDRAKQENILGAYHWCLFAVDSPYKSSHEVIAGFAKDFLAGEGNIIRHLGLLGYAVSYKQRKIDEFDFSVSNLATDLRDGVRLCRLVEILSAVAPLTLCGRTRVPAGSRLQKMYNVGLAFTALKEAGVSLKASARSHHVARRSTTAGAIVAKDIVDGHREKTLALLWSAISHWRLPDLVQPEEITKEIESLSSLNRRSAGAVEALLEAVGATADASKPEGLLMQWAQAVLARYGMAIRDWTASFADGRALCFLVHHYHPSLLPRKEISKTTASLAGGAAAVRSAKVSADSYAERIAGERSNFGLVKRSVAALGCVPATLPECDSSNIPEERSMIVFVAYLCSRLLDSGREERAAAIIGKVWRDAARRSIEARMTADTLNEYKRQQAAAVKIQAMSRGALFRTHLWEGISAVVQLQAIARGAACRASYAAEQAAHRELLCESAATTMQSCTRGWLARRTAQRTLSAIVLIQSTLRAFSARRRFQQVLAATAIASVWKAVRVRRVFVEKIASASLIKAVMRGWIVKQWFISMTSARFDAALRIQAATRGWQARQVVEAKKAAAATMVIVMALRTRALQKRVHMRTVEKSSAIRITALVRGFLARCYAAGVRNQQEAMAFVAVKLAAMFKGARTRSIVREARQQIIAEEAAALSIQRVFRGFWARLDMAEQQEAALMIENVFSAHLQFMAFRRAMAQHRAATTIASVARMWSQRAQFRGVFAVLKLQAAMRARRARHLTRCHRARITVAVKLGAAFRGAVARQRVEQLVREVQEQEFATSVIQRSFRSYLARTAGAKELRVDRSVQTIQRAARGLLARNRVRKAVRGIVWLQAVYRATRVRRTRRMQVAEAAARIQKANDLAASDASMTLGSRTRAALNVVLKSTQLSVVLKACVTLEVSTRLSQRCCESFAGTRAAPIIIALIRSCNRSKPHQKLVRVALAILHNVSQYDHLVGHVAEACESVTVLVDLLQMFRDIPAVGIPAIKLLLALCVLEDQKAVVRGDVDVMKRLKSIRSICVRKLALKQRGGAGGRSKVVSDEGRVVQLVQRLLKLLGE